MAAKHRLKFWRPDHGETIDDADELEIYTHWNLRQAAEEYADFYHSERDGWEARWPIQFYVGKEDKFLGIVEVDREAVPSFMGKVITNADSAESQPKGDSI